MIIHVKVKNIFSIVANAGPTRRTDNLQSIYTKKMMFLGVILFTLLICIDSIKVMSWMNMTVWIIYHLWRMYVSVLLVNEINK